MTTDRRDSASARITGVSTGNRDHRSINPGANPRATIVTNSRPSADSRAIPAAVAPRALVTESTSASPPREPSTRWRARGERLQVGESLGLGLRCLAGVALGGMGDIALTPRRAEPVGDHPDSSAESAQTPAATKPQLGVGDQDREREAADQRDHDAREGPASSATITETITPRAPGTPREVNGDGSVADRAQTPPRARRFRRGPPGRMRRGVRSVGGGVVASAEPLYASASSWSSLCLLRSACLAPAEGRFRMSASLRTIDVRGSAPTDTVNVYKGRGSDLLPNVVAALPTVAAFVSGWSGWAEPVAIRPSRCSS